MNVTALDAADPAECPNGPEILAYAVSRGLAGARLVRLMAFGWHLVGEESVDGLVGDIVMECGILYGGGSTGWHQIDPRLFIRPANEAEARRRRFKGVGTRLTNQVARAGAEAMAASLVRDGIAARVWLVGSTATDRPMVGDVDLVLELTEEAAATLGGEGDAGIDAFMAEKSGQLLDPAEVAAIDRVLESSDFDLFIERGQSLYIVDAGSMTGWRDISAAAREEDWRSGPRLLLAEAPEGNKSY